jgi:ribonucleoside-triphosphate reductase
MVLRYKPSKKRKRKKMSIKALQDYTYYSKYARYNKEAKRRETWSEAIERVKQMHLTYYAERIKVYPDLKEEIEWAFEQSRQKRVLGSQRALQFGGDPILRKHGRIYNCLKKTTQFITSKGVKSFTDFKDNDEIIVLTHTGAWKNAIVRCYGRQKLHRIVIKRGGASHEVFATKNHRWILSDGTITDNLQEEDTLLFAPNIFTEFDYSAASPDERLYWAYGYVYGDGTLVKNQNGEYKYSMVRLCGDDASYKERFEELGFSSSTSCSLNGDYIAFTGTYLKTLPDPKIDPPRLIRAFVRGFMDADGFANGNNYGKYGSPSPYCGIQQTGEKSVNFIRSLFPVAGVYLVSEEDMTGQETNFGIRDELTIRFRTINGRGHTAPLFRVESIEESCEEDVWCLEVEDDQSFVLPFGLVTGNCCTSFCDRIRFFQEAFWWLLCGSGCGFSVQKHHIAKLPEFTKKIPGYNSAEWLTIEEGRAIKKFLVPDSIEGWADALGVLLGSYFPHREFSNYEGFRVEFDYSLIRPAGSYLSSGNGKAPGPEPLRRSIEIIRKLLDGCISRKQKRLRPIDAYDIVMHTSDAVLSGGVRRSATICIFSPDDEEMIKAKTGNWFIDNPQRGRSNNSALLLRNSTKKEDFLKLIESVKEFGEPGFVWSDSTELMFNPCVEAGQWPVCIKTLESGWQVCNLCEQNGRKIKSKEDWVISARAASIIGTLQAGYTNFDYLGPVTKRIVEREALLGCSITGMMDNPEIIFDPKLQKELAKLVVTTNERLALKLGINPAARTTCIKPSGTASCVLGTGSGIHPHHAKRYLRRVQGNILEAPLLHFKKFNPQAVERSVWSANGTDEVVSFCVEVTEGKTKNDLDAVSMLEYVKLTQANWVEAGCIKSRCTQPWLTHSVSNTINIRPDEWEAVANFIFDNRKYFSGISLLPISGDKDYPQAPMVAIYSPKELVQMYGDGMPLASGLIVDGLSAFDGNLWKACDAALNQGESMDKPKFDSKGSKNDSVIHIEYEKHLKEYKKWKNKVDWVRRAKQFAERYFNNDVRNMTYCLKDVNNWKVFLDLKRTYTDVDYTTMIEETDETKPMDTIACAGGACQI